MLARAFQEQQDHAGALRYFRLVLKATAELGRDKDFRRLVRQSEEATGETESIVKKDRFYASKTFFFGALAAVALVAAVLVNWYISQHRSLTIVNPLSEAITIEIDGTHQRQIGPDSRAAIELAEGTHASRVLSPDDIDVTVPFTMKTSWFGRFYKSPVFVLDPTRTAALVWETAIYSEHPSDDEGEFTFHVGQGYVSYEDCDYAFEKFPDQIRVEGRNQRVTKSRIDQLQLEPSQIPFMAATGGMNREETLELMERVLPFYRHDERLLAVYIGMTMSNGQMDRCREFLAKGLDRQPIEIPWHRMYQSVSQREGRTEELDRRYGQLLQADPDNSALLYLQGRLQPTLRGSQDLFRKAIQSDETNGYALSALAFCDAVAGDFAAADEKLRRAIELQPEREELKMRHFDIRFALGDFESLEDELSAQLEEDAINAPAHSRYLQVLAAQGKLAEADQVHQQLADSIAEVWPDDPNQIVLNSKAELLYLKGDFVDLLAEAERLEDAEAAARWKVYGHLGNGQPAEATKHLASLSEPNPGAAELSVSLAFREEGNSSEAEKWREAAIAKLAASSSSHAYIANLLRRASEGPVALEDAENIGTEAGMKAVALLELAAHQAGIRTELLTLARQLNQSRRPPYQVIARGIRSL
jgi:Tfp pilus assembly protein PilF